MSKHSAQKGRSEKKQVSEDTLAICEAGTYTCEYQSISIAAQLADALQGTVLYRPEASFVSSSCPKVKTRISVRNEQSLEGAQRLVENYNLSFEAGSTGPAVLNFASAKNPGGGFLGGATAQEESLARSSALYKCLIKFQDDFYDGHRCARDEPTRLCIYTSSCIYSPAVPVFRSSDLSLLTQPYPVSFVTCPAVNMSNAQRVNVSWKRGLQAMQDRAKRVLQVMQAHGHKYIVLGAWGCGVFKNPPRDIAKVFADLLGPRGGFHGVFEHIVFSVLDVSKDKETFRIFRDILDNSNEFK